MNNQLLNRVLQMDILYNPLDYNIVCGGVLFHPREVGLACAMKNHNGTQ